ncbi:hypothetical protein DEA06_14675 [Microbacterium sp. Gd 4-13]|uniref:hypothetical protein n=1 Tax=Microbacterium sp. Gd 4-13 TaxID=2173179 RepID=UPI000D5762C7|nr:hypothetical protein [Microbacterium sp. Gd 4-13]PVW03005.1 hypothetical protein DEA06_14675 [Microbacterium sp. Gd 4-13]
MNFDDPVTDANFDRQLTDSAPPTTPLTPSIEDELARMSVHARTDHARSRNKRGVAAKAAAFAIAGVVVLGGAGAAAAATGGWWSSWWADEPDSVASYTLPSGAQCEHRVGGLMVGTKDEPIRVAAREWLASADLDAIIASRIDARVVEVRADQLLVEGPDGTTIPAVIDTRTDDSVYSRAVSEVIYGALTDSLERQGFDLEFGPNERGLEISAEISCPGAQW